MITELAPGYSAECAPLDRETWHRIISGFDDASIFQTWTYQAVRNGEKSLSHLVLRKDGAIVAAAQARIAKLPFMNLGVAYLRWAPMWRPHGETAELEVFGQALRALRNEYVFKRHLVLRIRPITFDDEMELFHPLFLREGFLHPVYNVTQRTLIVDLNHSLEELRKGLQPKWRQNLKTAEKSDLVVLEGHDDDLFGAFLKTYKETHRRKKFLETSNVHHFREMQKSLADPLRMRIWVAFTGDTPAAGVVCSHIGRMGVFLYGGTSDLGLKLHGSNLCQWKALTWLKEQGATCYNLGGINRSRNPGTYQFKAGLCGKNGREVCSVGVYDSYRGTLVSGAFQCVNLARTLQRETRITIRAIKSSWERQKRLDTGRKGVLQGLRRVSLRKAKTGA